MNNDLLIRLDRMWNRKQKSDSSLFKFTKENDEELNASIYYLR